LLAFVIRRFNHLAIRGVVIVEALVAGTGAEELTNALAFLKGLIRSSHPPENSAQIEETIGKLSQVENYGLPSDRALNNEIAYTILCCLYLEVDVRLTGLRHAAHLNGREGIIRCRDPANSDRYEAVLDDGTCVSVLASNFMHIRRGNYMRRSP
jgi:hypothetical protein